MANYYGAFRSNYFKVTDAQKLKEMVGRNNSRVTALEIRFL